jgi:hypothetical protein
MHLGAQFRPDDRDASERRVDQLLARAEFPARTKLRTVAGKSPVGPAALPFGLDG